MKKIFLLFVLFVSMLHASESSWTEHYLSGYSGGYVPDTQEEENFLQEIKDEEGDTRSDLYGNIFKSNGLKLKHIIRLSENSDYKFFIKFYTEHEDYTAKHVFKFHDNICKETKQEFIFKIFVRELTKISLYEGIDRCNDYEDDDLGYGKALKKLLQNYKKSNIFNNVPSVRITNGESLNIDFSLKSKASCKLDFINKYEKHIPLFQLNHTYHVKRLLEEE